MNTAPRVDSNLATKLGQLWCWFWTGHSNLAVYSNPPAPGKQSWHLHCSNCGHNSPGVEVEPTKRIGYSNADFEDIHAFMQDTELGLHGGG